MASLVTRIINRAKRQKRIWRHKYFDTFMFIHINKTGGTSIVKALDLPGEHRTALEKIQELGRKRWDNCFSFAVIRNPWDKVVSHYAYRVQTNQTGLGAKDLEFKDWVRAAYGDRDPAYYDRPKMFQSQTDWCVDETGTIVVNHFCRFENLNADFAEVCQKIGKNVELPHLKSSKRGNYREYYDDQTRDIIADRFAKDLENFKYEF